MMNKKKLKKLLPFLVSPSLTFYYPLQNGKNFCNKKAHLTHGLTLPTFCI